MFENGAQGTLGDGAWQINRYRRDIASVRCCTSDHVVSAGGAQPMISPLTPVNVRVWGLGLHDTDRAELRALTPSPAQSSTRLLHIPSPLL